MKRLTTLLVGLLALSTAADPELSGVLCFRGNASRTYYGSGPVPTRPVVRWKAPLGGSGDWVGTGWTGQPAVVQWRDQTEVIVGGLDGKLRFFDARSGKVTRRPFALPAGGSIKSSVTVDPAARRLFVGNRGGNYWALSLADLIPKVLLRIQGECDPRSGATIGYWPDFDSSGLVADDTLFVGGENGWFYRIPLATMARRDTWRTAYTPTISSLAHENLVRSNGYCSIESSPALTSRRVYLATGAGMVLGLNRQNLKLEFQFSTGDDTDAAVVVNRNGYLFVAAQCDYGGDNRTRLYKLDPNVGLKNWRKAILWKRTFEAYPQKGGPGFEDNLDAGILGTPALGPGPDGEPEARLYVGVATRPGKEGWLLCLDSRTGTTIWAARYGAHVWSSPVVVDGKVLLADASGNLRCHRARDGKELWRKALGGTIESTPVVWKGWIYVGARDGYFYALSDK